MRRKKHLEERMEGCSSNMIVYKSDDLNFSSSQEASFIDTAAFFGNSNPIELEVGCGKGSFIVQLAKLRPEVNYIAVERSANVIVTAAESAAEENAGNVLFVNCQAEYLPRLIAQHSVHRIYLNFSCPFPKNKYAVHRLTNDRFLEIYRELLAEGGEIHQKTDNRPFFDYSLMCYEHCGFEVSEVTYDLAHSGFEGNIMTEYESRFTALGVPICRAVAKPK
jgi:tRNA (guanine-N7-)-methyltransferase